MSGMKSPTRSARGYSTFPRNRAKTSRFFSSVTPWNGSSTALPGPSTGTTLCSKVRSYLRSGQVRCTARHATWTFWASGMEAPENWTGAL